MFFFRWCPHRFKLVLRNIKSLGHMNTRNVYQTTRMRLCGERQQFCDIIFGRNCVAKK